MSSHCSAELIFVSFRVFRGSINSENENAVQRNSRFHRRAAGLSGQRRVLRHQTPRHRQRLEQRPEARPRADRVRSAGHRGRHVHDQPGLRRAGESLRRAREKRRRAGHRRQFRQRQRLHRQTRLEGRARNDARCVARRTSATCRTRTRSGRLAPGASASRCRWPMSAPASSKPRKLLGNSPAQRRPRRRSHHDQRHAAQANRGRIQARRQNRPHRRHLQRRGHDSAGHERHRRAAGRAAAARDDALFHHHRRGHRGESFAGRACRKPSRTVSIASPWTAT